MAEEGIWNLPDELLVEFLQKEKERIRIQAQKKKQKRKRLLITAGTIVLTLLAAMGVTAALLNTRTETVDNAFNFGQTKVTVVENEDYDWNKKEVRLTAASGADYVPGVVRAMIVPYVLDSSGNYISADLGDMPETITGNTVVLGDITLELAGDWSTNWFYKEGYFYYQKVLKPGQTTELLLNKVSLTDSDTADMGEKYADTKIKIEVMAGILQAEGGAPEAEWGVTVTGNTVSP